MRSSYDNTAYKKAKAKLPRADGKHCIICRRKLPKYKRKYCSTECWSKWYNELAPPVYWNDMRYRTIKRDNFTCQGCKTKFENDEKLEVDHIKAVALGGNIFDMDNLQTLCHECHANKTKRDIEKINIMKNIPFIIRNFYTTIEEIERNQHMWNRYLKR